tara:strand:+ start:3589 stop:4596 length:1008 start_codon:yes stop_codon:yes gene_type:complete
MIVLMKKNILLTGGAGYIGSWFVQNYSEKYNIFIVDSLFFGKNLNLEESIKVINKDIRNISLDDLKNINYVIHMAELSNDPLGEINKELTQEINVSGTKKLIYLCQQAKIEKFIYMSSCSVYGDSGNTYASEETSTNPLTEYAKAKVLNENYLLDNEFEFEVKILRNATAFGYSANIRTDLVINDLTVSAIENNHIRVLSDGSPRRPFVHIGDISRFIDYVINNDDRKKLLVNIGTEGLNLTVKNVAKIVSQLTNVDDISFGKSDGDTRSYFVNFSKVSKLFPKFNFKYEVRDGVNEIIDNFESVIMNKTNSKRIKRINELIDSKKINTKLFWTA